MLKKVLVAAAIAGAALATPAVAETACVDLYLDINGTAQTVQQCV